MEQLKLLDLPSAADTAVPLDQRQRCELVTLMAQTIQVVYKAQKGKGDERDTPQDQTSALGA